MVHHVFGVTTRAKMDNPVMRTVALLRRHCVSLHASLLVKAAWESRLRDPGGRDMVEETRWRSYWRCDEAVLRDLNGQQRQNRPWWSRCSSNFNGNTNKKILLQWPQECNYGTGRYTLVRYKIFAKHAHLLYALVSIMSALRSAYQKRFKKLLIKGLIIVRYIGMCLCLSECWRAHKEYFISYLFSLYRQLQNGPPSRRENIVSPSSPPVSWWNACAYFISQIIPAPPPPPDDHWRSTKVIRDFLSYA